MLTIDTDLQTMTETQLYAEMDSQAGQAVGSSIASSIGGLTEQERKILLQKIIQIMRMVAGG